VFDLTEQLAGAADARIGVQLAGDVSAQVCHSDRSMGAVLSLAPSSGLEIELEGPLTSVRDVLALTPRQVVIAMDDGEAWFELATRLGARLNRNGFVVTMINLDDAAAVVEAGAEGVILAGSREICSALGFCQWMNARLRAPACGGAPGTPWSPSRMRSVSTLCAFSPASCLPSPVGFRSIQSNSCLLKVRRC
jgi:hypothetical protein